MKTTDIEKIDQLFADFEELTTDESGQLAGGISTTLLPLQLFPDEQKQEVNYFQCGCNNYQCGK